MDRDERFDNRQYNDAVRDLKKAYKQFSDFDWKADLDEPKRAVWHLQKSRDDFNAAMTHIAKLDVGREQQGAVNDINKGIKEIESAVTADNNGDVDSAQKHYNKAATEFNKAASILD